MYAEMFKPTDDHEVTDHVRKKWNILQNCGGLQWNLSGIYVCGEFLQILKPTIQIVTIHAKKKNLFMEFCY